MNIVVTTPSGGKVRYRNFTNARVQAKMGQMTREFEFVAATRSAADIPFYTGQAVEIFDGEDRLFTGFIERISLGSSGKGHKYAIAGRDKMADVVDSNLTKMYDLSIPLPDICRFVLKFLGVDAKVIDEAGTAGVNIGYVATPDPGDTAGEFLSEIARRKRVLLQSDADGNMVITTGIGANVETELVNRIDGVGNNLLTADFVIDFSKRFGRVSSMHQIDLAGAGSATKRVRPENLVAREYTVSDPAIRQSRFRVVPDDMNTIATDARLRPLWEVALNRAESVKYNVTVPGFRDWEGRLWGLNTAPRVFDEYNGISNRMLIAGIEYIMNAEGSTTKLSLTDRQAFQAELKIRKEFVVDGPPEE